MDRRNDNFPLIWFPIQSCSPKVYLHHQTCVPLCSSMTWCLMKTTIKKLDVRENTKGKPLFPLPPFSSSDADWTAFFVVTETIGLSFY